MRTLLAVAACALLLSPAFAQDDGGGDEAKTDDSADEIGAPAAPAPAAPRRTGGPAYAAPGRRPSVNPASAPSSGGGGGGSVPIPSDAPAGISDGGGDAKPQREVVRDQDKAEAPAPSSGGDASFTEIDIGLLPTIQSVTGQSSGGGRPVIMLAGGRKWAIRMRHKGPDKANFNILLGGTNGALTGAGKYSYKAAISPKKGDLGGSCVGEMVNAAYVTCQQPCSMQWDLRFAWPPARGTCALQNDKVYYLNILPSGNGCVGGDAAKNGCPLVMEVSNGGTIELSEHRK